MTWSVRAARQIRLWRPEFQSEPTSLIQTIRVIEDHRPDLMPRQLNPRSTHSDETVHSPPPPTNKKTEKKRKIDCHIHADETALVLIRWALLWPRSARRVNLPACVCVYVCVWWRGYVFSVSLSLSLFLFLSFFFSCSSSSSVRTSISFAELNEKCLDQ